MDGTDPVKIITGSTEIDDLSIDMINSELYWTDSGIIYRSDLDGENVIQVEIPNLGHPLGLSINNRTLYWSRKRTNESGSIFSYSLVNGEVQKVIERSTLYPGDISTFVSMEIIQSG